MLTQRGSPARHYRAALAGVARTRGAWLLRITRAGRGGRRRVAGTMIPVVPMAALHHGLMRRRRARMIVLTHRTANYTGLRDEEAAGEYGAECACWGGGE